MPFSRPGKWVHRPGLQLIGPERRADSVDAADVPCPASNAKARIWVLGGTWDLMRADLGSLPSCCLAAIPAGHQF